MDASLRLSCSLAHALMPFESAVDYII